MFDLYKSIVVNIWFMAIIAVIVGITAIWTIVTGNYDKLMVDSKEEGVI